jgi:capsular polysaccharide biosynthesis protein
MSEQSFNQPLEDEISLKNIIDLLKESWRIILGAGFIGLLGSMTFLVITPNQYEVVAQIQMLQISSNNSSGNNANPLGVNIEEPNLLLARLKLPTTYGAAEIKECGLEKEKMASESLVAMSKFSVVKGTSSVIELKINMKNREQAFKCSRALFEMIRESQNNLIRPYIQEAKELLTNYEERVNATRGIVARADKSGAALSAAYLANRDEVKFLTDEIIRLNNFISNSDARQTKLVSPIYVSEIPVFPKKNIALISGLLAGFFLGLVLASIQKFWIAYKVS